MSATNQTVSFLAGKKSYLVSISAIIYALGINRGWWPHQADIDVALAGTYGVTIRAALKKLYLQLLASNPAIRPGSPLMRALALGALIPALVLTSCAASTTSTQSASTTANAIMQNAGAFANSPAGLQLEKQVEGAALNAGLQYATTGKVNPQGVVGAALYGSESSLYPLMGSTQASSPVAVQNAVASGANVPAVSSQVAPVVSASVTSQITSGTAPSQAVANVAVVVDKVAANPPPVPTPSPSG